MNSKMFSFLFGIKSSFLYHYLHFYSDFAFQIFFIFFLFIIFLFLLIFGVLIFNP